jgi:hypothetical protein
MMEPIDQSKIEDFVRERRDPQQHFVDRFCRRYSYKMTELFLGMLSWIPAAAVIGILYLLSKALGLELWSNQTQNFFTADAAFALFVMHPLGTFAIWFSNLWAESLLPNRSNLVLHLVVGTCCFSDNILSCRQALVLSLTHILFAAGLYICFAAAFVLANPSLNRKEKTAHSSSDDDLRFADIMVFLGCLTIPICVFYVLFKGCYRCFRGRRRDLAGEYAQAYNQARQEEILCEGPSATGIELV